MPSSSFLIRDVRIFTGTEVIDNGSVLVKDGRIASVSSSSQTPSDNSITQISKPGHTLLPGLIDSHIHADKGNPLALTQALNFGVTTVCDLHNEPWNVRSLRALAAKDKSQYASFKSSSLAATVPGGWPEAVVTLHDHSEETAAEIAAWPKLVTKEDVDAYIDARVEDRADYIKLMHESGAGLKIKLDLPPVELQKQVIDGAHSKDLVAMAHALAKEATLEMLEAGIDGLTHSFLDAACDEAVVAAYKRNNAFCIPTLAAVGSLTKEGHAEQEGYAHDPRVQQLLGEAEKHRLCMCMGMANETSKAAYAYDSVRQLKAAGIDIVCGSDAASPAVGTAWGLSLHHELWLMVNKCGFTPQEALHSATVLPPKRLRFSDWEEVGEIKEGLRADLVLVEGNPLEDISNTLNLRGIWREGVLAKRFVGQV